MLRPASLLERGKYTSEGHTLKPRIPVPLHTAVNHTVSFPAINANASRCEGNLGGIQLEGALRALWGAVGKPYGQAGKQTGIIYHSLWCYAFLFSFEFSKDLLKQKQIDQILVGKKAVFTVFKTTF